MVPAHRGIRRRAHRDVGRAELLAGCVQGELSNPSLLKPLAIYAEAASRSPHTVRHL